MDVADLVAVVRLVAANDADHDWVVRPLLAADREALRGIVLDPTHARGIAGWVVNRDAVPALALMNGRLHWGAMSVQIDRDPWLAVAQLLRVVDGLQHGPDSRPGAGT